MESYFKKITFLIFLFSFLITFFVVKAVTIPNPLGDTTFEDLIDSLINFVLYFAVAIFPIMVIIAGFFFLSSGGDPAKVKTAKNLLLYSVIGLFIVLLARGIISMIKSILGTS